MRLLIIAIVAATLGYTLSVVINSTVSAATLVGFGIEVTFSDRFDMAVTEWLGLASTYLPIYVGLHAVVFLLLHRVLLKTTEFTGGSPNKRKAFFALAGALSLLLVYMAFDAAMGLSGVLVASGRTLSGLIANVATGAVSGLVFAAVSGSPPKPDASA
jgi:hypothetical protein